MRDIAVLGAGYVGLTTAAGFTHLGYRVRIGEPNPHRLAALQDGRLPVSEPGLADLIAGAVAGGLLSFHASNAEAAVGAAAVYLAVPTPAGEGGQVDLRFVTEAVRSVLPVLSGVLVVKSSVPPGTARFLRRLLTAEGCDVPLVVNPEFLEEGRAVRNVLEPSRIVVGSDDPDALRRVADLLAPFGCPLMLMDATSAELTKYASNAYLATRVSFVNTVTRIADAVHADIDHVLAGMAADPRIGGHYLRPGPGYGGSCFPKDVPALIHASEERGYAPILLSAVVDTNEEQLRWVVRKVRAAVGDVDGAVVGLLGLAFKAGTDDLRDSPAIQIASLLTAAGAQVQGYDPAVQAPAWMSGCADLYAAATGADVLVVATEWPEFAAADYRRCAEVMRGSSVVDVRNLLNRETIAEAGLRYEGLGRN